MNENNAHTRVSHEVNLLIKARYIVNNSIRDDKEWNFIKVVICGPVSIGSVKSVYTLYDKMSDYEILISYSLALGNGVGMNHIVKAKIACLRFGFSLNCHGV